MTIEEFIEARLAERETTANETIELEQQFAIEGYGYEYQWARFRTQNGKPQSSYTFEPGAPTPTEVVRQCAALRAIVAYIEAMVSPSQQIEAENDVLHPIAAIWSDHPDYQQEWAA